MGIMFLNFLDVDNYDAEASEEDDTIDGSDSEGEEEYHEADDEDSDDVNEQHAGMQRLPDEDQRNIDADNSIEYEMFSITENGHGRVKKRYIISEVQ